MLKKHMYDRRIGVLLTEIHAGKSGHNAGVFEDGGLFPTMSLRS